MDTLRLLNALQASGLVSPRVRRRLLGRMGAECHSNARILQGNFFGSGRISFGPNCFISVGSIFDGSDQITIGADVHIAPGVQIATSSHEIGPARGRAGARTTAPVVIGAGCWIGMGAMIMPGVTIAAGCIVGAGALVTKSTEPNGLYTGVPARRERDLL